MTRLVFVGFLSWVPCLTAAESFRITSADQSIIVEAGGVDSGHVWLPYSRPSSDATRRRSQGGFVSVTYGSRFLTNHIHASMG